MPRKARSIAEMLDQACDTLDMGTKAMSACSERVAAMLDSAEKFDMKLSSHLAWITKQHADVIDSLRQLEKHERGMAKTPAQRFELVRAYLRDLDVEHRALLRQDLDEANTGSVLE